MQGGPVAGKESSCSPSLFAAEGHRAGMAGSSQHAQNVPQTPSVTPRLAAPGCVLFQFVRGKLGAGRVADPWTGCSVFEATWHC